MNEEIVQRVRQCPTLPSLPSIAVQVLELAQKSEVDMGEIARIISRDPALSGKILRTVNSSFYGRSQHVSTISHALVILGLQSVKTLVLGFSLVSNLSKNKSKGFKHIEYWRRSIFAATAARTIAAKISLVQQEEAFLAALLMDIGMLVLDQVLGEPYGELYSKIKTHNELAVTEKQTLDITHAEVGSILAENWKLPPLLAVPILHHHSADQVTDPPLRKLTELAWLSGRCADVFIDAEAAPAIADVRRACQERHNISGAECDALLAEIGKSTKEVASLFEINIGSSAHYDAILKKANEALVDLTLQSQIQNSALQQQNQELKQQATTDGLTGLANRARFDVFINDAMNKSAKGSQPLALLMIDLDKFKLINDTHGHPAGDTVLRTLGKLLQSALRPQDLAARYGGEEMVLVLPNTTRAAASRVAETVRRAIASRPIMHGQKPIPVTASIGVSCFDSTCPLSNAAQLIKAADLALYNAKRSGRNCVRIFTLPSAAKKVVPPATPGSSNSAAA